MIEPEKHELFRKGDEVATYRREVETPMPENEDGSGYTSEENYQWAYRAGQHWIKVRKVSDRGWSVWHYVEVDDGMEIGGNVASKLNAQEAQRTALKKAEVLA